MRTLRLEEEEEEVVVVVDDEEVVEGGGDIGSMSSMGTESSIGEKWVRFPQFRSN